MSYKPRNIIRARLSSVTPKGHNSAHQVVFVSDLNTYQQAREAEMQQ